jgi:transmembrane sensor
MVCARLVNSYMQKQRDLIEEAQQWARILRNGDPVDQTAFATWIKRSPQHLEAYLRNVSVETEIQRLDANGNFDIQTLLTEASANVIQLPSGTPLRTSTSPPRLERRKLWRVSATIAASGMLVTCLILAGIRTSHSQWTDYTTDTGEQRRIVLADGSIIELNTKSHIRVSIQSNSRAVNLLTGEVLFNVQHDSHRPFRVRVADQTVEDLGTQFSIYLRPDASTTISVLNGHVQVSPVKAERTSGATSSSGESKLALIPSTEVSAGEEIRIAASGRLIKRTAINVSEAAPWREHRLWFDGASLQEVAAEFNRYNRRQLRIDSDPALLKKRYTGVFDTYDPESFVEALRDDPTLAVQWTKEAVLIGAR